MPLTVIRNKKKSYTCTHLVAAGDLADVYATDSGEVVKIAREKTDNDLLENEAAVVNFLRPPAAKPGKLDMFIPQLINTFISDGQRVNMFKLAEGHVTLADIIAAYPGGIDFRDMVWMYKRLLSAIGFAHVKGVIHGAILPTHFLVHPVEHNAHLIDWCYALNFAALPKPAPDPTAPPDPPPAPPKMDAWALLRTNLYADATDPTVTVPIGPPPDPDKMYIRAISVDFTDWYAPEILRRERPSPATDIYMAAKCAVALLGGDVRTNQMPDTVPVQIKAFLSGSLLPAQSKRPQDAWDLHEQFDTLLRAIVGPPKYRLFTMPTKGDPTP